MKKFRLSFAFLLLALVLAVVPAALAQDETFGLSQADYDLWTSANAATAGVDTLSFDFTAAFAANGLTDTDVSAKLQGTGMLDTNSDNPQFQLDVTGTVGDTNQMSDVTFGLRVVDGYLYVNDGSGWQGRTLESAMGTVSSMLGTGMEASGANIDPSQIESGDLSGLAGMSGVSDAMSALGDLQPSDFISLVRSDMGNDAVFTLNFDLGKLLASPSVAPMLGSAMGGTSGDMTPEQAQQMGAMMAGMFSTSTISFAEYVDGSTVNRAMFDVNIPLDMMGAGAGMSVNFDLSLSGVNEPVSVEAPADATMMDDSAAS